MDGIGAECFVDDLRPALLRSGQVHGLAVARQHDPVVLHGRDGLCGHGPADFGAPVGAGADGVDDFQVLVVDDLHGAHRRGHLIFEHGREVERAALFRRRVDGLFERCEAFHAVFRVVDRERAVEEVVQP